MSDIVQQFGTCPVRYSVRRVDSGRAVLCDGLGNPLPHQLSCDVGNDESGAYVRVTLRIDGDRVRLGNG